MVPIVIQFNCGQILIESALHSCYSNGCSVDLSVPGGRIQITSIYLSLYIVAMQMPFTKSAVAWHIHSEVIEKILSLYPLYFVMVIA